MVETSLKRKQPPTFRHLPLNRAKKLKQTWVQNAKIKSKWKAQKRKEAALITSGPKENEGEESYIEELEPKSEKEELELEEKQTPPKSAIHPSWAHIKPELARKGSYKRQKEQDEANTPSEPPPSLRDLTREAYSRTSLHTFKSGRGRGVGQGAYQGRGRNNPQGNTRKGQPNMKLRMGAMLEKIKQDLVR